MKSVYLYTENFFYLPRFKNQAKKMLGQIRGPQAVFASLTRGLDELNVSYEVNSRCPPQGIIACVISGVRNLNWAIKQKCAGRISKIVAGPNLVINPNDSGGVLRNPTIDKIVAPSMWVKEFYIKIANELSSKIHIWPAGVDLPEIRSNQPSFDFLVLKKSVNNFLVACVLNYLKANQLSFKLIRYGHFSQSKYYSLLAQSKFLLYLSESESQGLAMLEAWARNVPSLVWEPGVYEKDGAKIFGQIASPYMSLEAGRRFKNFEEFKKFLPEFLVHHFAPREYAAQNFNHKLCARKYLKIINA